MKYSNVNQYAWKSKYDKLHVIILQNTKKNILVLASSLLVVVISVLYETREIKRILHYIVSSH